MKSSERVKAAVVGCGRIGEFHAEKYSKMDEVELVYVCDLNFSRAEKLAKQFNCLPLSNFRELVGSNVNCVSIASDTQSHYLISKDLLEKGIDVLIEKPITSNVAEAEQLLTLAKETNSILQVGHVERYNPVIKKVKQNLKDPWFFEIRRISSFSGRGADVDVVLDLMIHDIDLLLYFVNKPVEKIEAMGIPVLTNTIDVANARISFEGGIVANVSASRAAFQSERSFRIFQPENYISMDLELKKVKIVSIAEGKLPSGFSSIEKYEEKFDLNDSLGEEIRSFIDCVKSRELPFVSGQDGLNALLIVDEIKNAMRNSAKKFKKIPEELLRAIDKYKI
jgi:predicted dehydrogenase